MWPIVRKRLRFGLRTLLVLTTVAALALGWIASRAERQRRAVEAILASGGQLRYAHEVGKNGSVLTTEPVPPGPAWLRRWLGPHYFFTVHDVYLDLRQADPDPAWRLSDCPGVKRLLLSRGRLTASQAKAIATARSLDELNTYDVMLDEAGCAPLANLQSVRTISIQLGSCEPGGLRRLCDIPNVREFMLMNAQVEPGALLELAGLADVEFLELSYVAARDADVAAIEKLPKLRYLRLFGTAITPKRVEQLQREHAKLDVTCIPAE